MHPISQIKARILSLRADNIALLERFAQGDIRCGVGDLDSTSAFIPRLKRQIAELDAIVGGPLWNA